MWLCVDECTSALCGIVWLCVDECATALCGSEC